MLKEVSGDILFSKAEVIAHGVAPGDHFNQGLALALRERYPAMAKDFRHYCQISHPKAGELWTWAGAEGVRIANLMTQDEATGPNSHPGKATSHNVGAALRGLRGLIEQESIASVALPRLATGVGGMKWDDVRELIDRHLGDLSIPVFLYTTYRPGVEADE